MNRPNFYAVVILSCGLGVFLAGLPAQSNASSPVVIGVDGLIANLDGDLFPTFTYGAGPVKIASPEFGRYRGFVFGDTDASGGSGFTANYSLNVDTPIDNFDGDLFTDGANGTATDFESQYFPLLDQAAFGSVFAPDEYEIQIEYRPFFQSNVNQNAAPFFNVVIEQFDGFIDDGSGVGKRSAEQIGYQIGDVGEGEDVNAYWQNNQQANGFATYSVPVNTPTFNQKGYLFEFGDGTFRDSYVAESDDGADFDAVEGISPLPNGAIQLNIQSSQTGDTVGDVLALDIKSIRVVKINPEPGLIARLDGESGISVISGSPFLNEADVTIPGDSHIYSPVRTDQLSRVDASGITNLVINTDDDLEDGVFGAFQVADYQTFDGTDAFVRLTARLTEELDGSIQGETVTVTLKDLDGNDEAAGEGGEEYTYNVDLNGFNTATFTTLDVPLSTFSLDPTAFEFTNEGDGSLVDFNLYYLGMFISSGGGLIDLEIESLEVRIPVPVLAGDYNGDGTVDAADYTVWRDGGPLQNETASPGVIDQADYDAWVGNFGATASNGSASSVPEPTCSLLASLVLGFAGLQRRRSVNV